MANANYTNTSPSTAPWDTPGLPDRHPDERCRWHSGLCAYRDDDPARCPLCHAAIATGNCTCVPGHATLSPELLGEALKWGHQLASKELAATFGLTSLAAERIRHRATTKRLSDGERWWETGE